MTHEAGTPDVLVLPRLDVVEEVAAAVTGREHWIAVSLDPTITLARLWLHHLPAATVYIDSPAGLVLRLTGAAVSEAAVMIEMAGMFTDTRTCRGW